MTIDPIKIRGLRDFQAGLKTMDGESQKKLRVTMNEVAETIAAGTRRRVPTRTGRAKGTVKVASSQREARVKAGGAKAPYYPWLDFGGVTTRGASRPYIKDKGRYLYVTYGVSRAGIQAALEKALTDLATESGFTVG